MLHFGFNWLDPRATLMSLFSRMALAADCGTAPASARVSVAATSTSSHVRNLLSSLQMRPISDRVYRVINRVLL